MSRIETETNNFNLIENNRFKIIELYQKHPNVFRAGIDKENHNFLITRSINELPNILIVEEGCRAIIGVDENNNTSPLNINILPQDLFNKIPNIPPIYSKNNSKVHILSQSEDRKHFFGFKIIGEKFQLQSNEKKKFLEDMIFLAEQKYQNLYRSISSEINFVLIPSLTNSK